MNDSPRVSDPLDDADADGWLLDRLRELLPAQWDLLLGYAHVPGEYVAGGTAAQGTRATDVLRWSRLSVNYECALLETLAKVEPAFAADVERRLAKLRAPQPGTHDRLAEVQEQYDLARASGDTARVPALKAELLRLKLERRAGGQIHAGDILAGHSDDGRYKLLDPLGKGGFATVWKAYDRQARRFVAVKVLHADQARDQSRRERFFRGARAMARLDHPHIVRVFEPHAEDDGWHYFVMALIEGQDLDSAVRAGHIDAEHGLDLVIEIADALRHAHANGLVHRDVAPPNILVDRAGHAHLGDFDLVRAEDSVGGTRTSMLGRFIYAAPELMSDPKRADARTDVYALGMTLAFVYAREPLPLTALTTPGAYLGSLPLPPGVRAVVERAIRHEMGERFDSVAAFAAELRAACSRGEAPHVTARAVVSRERPTHPEPGDVWTQPETGLTFVWIPPGEFLMGSSMTEGELGYDPRARDWETPARRVRISEGFWLGQHPVTNRQYARFVAEAQAGVEPRFSGERRFNRPQQPVVGVSFDDASAFCAWATKRAALAGETVIQLPTEAEWEYAARGEEGRRYPWGSAEPTPERALWAWPWDLGAPGPIAERPQGATPLGVHDLAGNVWEWCLDAWRDQYPSSSALDVDPCFRASRAAPRVLRGGSWDDEGGDLRGATRLRLDPGERDLDFGFRVVFRRFRAYLTD